ncbi:hypothetical protein P692DRAFT_20811834 [Suillus brevipes Sb2]|nr:hypothetical protein P692DRAFT_20811834 [Suillus brevipes Sb2]
MAAKLKVLEDSNCESATSPPPSYKTTASSLSLADSAQCTGSRPFVLSFSRTTQKKKTVLSRIRDIISAPSFAPSSVTPVVSACAAILSPAAFSHLLQTPNIEGHTALYWAIVNNRREAFSVFAAFIPRFSSVCCSDLRLACMMTSDHELFTQLNLGRYPRKDELLRRSLGCPPDEAVVHEGDEPRQFIACIRIRMFQERLRIRRDMSLEFIARGRIWRLHIHSVGTLRWILIGFSRHTLPVRLPIRVAHCDVMIESHRGKSKHATRAIDSQWRHEQRTLHGDTDCLIDFPPWMRSDNLERPKSGAPGDGIAFFHHLGKWVTDDNTEYVDCDGTLHAAVVVTLW